MTLDGWLLIIALGLIFLNACLWPRATLLVITAVFFWGLWKASGLGGDHDRHWS
jgi:hypothetical protein